MHPSTWCVISSLCRYFVISNQILFAWSILIKLLLIFSCGCNQLAYYSLIREHRDVFSSLFKWVFFFLLLQSSAESCHFSELHRATESMLEVLWWSSDSVSVQKTIAVKQAFCVGTKKKSEWVCRTADLYHYLSFADVALPNTLTHSSSRGLLIYAWVDFFF